MSMFCLTWRFESLKVIYMTQQNSFVLWSPANWTISPCTCDEADKLYQGFLWTCSALWRRCWGLPHYDGTVNSSWTASVPKQVVQSQEKSTGREVTFMGNAILVSKVVFHLEQYASYRVFHLSRLYCSASLDCILMQSRLVAGVE